MDLTLPSFAHHAPRQQQQQGQQWAQVATAPAMAVGASTRRWREILLQVVAQDDDLSQLRKDQPAAPAGLAADGAPLTHTADILPVVQKSSLYSPAAADSATLLPANPAAPCSAACSAPHVPTQVKIATESW